MKSAKEFGTIPPSPQSFVPSQPCLVLEFRHNSTIPINICPKSTLPSFGIRPKYTIQCSICRQSATMSLSICHKSTIEEICRANSTSPINCHFGLIPPSILNVGIFPPPVFSHKSTSNFGTSTPTLFCLEEPFREQGNPGSSHFRIQISRFQI